MKFNWIGKYGNILLLPASVLALLMGLATPTYFTTVSEETLRDLAEQSSPEQAGEGATNKTLASLAEDQLKANNIGPVELLLPLLSPADREAFGGKVAERKEAHPTLAVSGGGSISDRRTFEEYFGGLDKFSLTRGRTAAFNVYNRAATRGNLWEALSKESLNDNVREILASIPREGRPGAFWATVLKDPNVTEFSGPLVVRLENFRFFPKRRLLISVVLKEVDEMDVNATEADLRDACLAEARKNFTNGDYEPRLYKLGRSDLELSPETNASASADGGAGEQLAAVDYSAVAPRLGILRAAPTEEGGYRMVLGGVVGPDGKPEEHGRWLPYPMLLPMMLGTAMAVDEEYFSANLGTELGQLSRGMLNGDLASKEKLRAFYWAAHQLAGKLNLVQMAELTRTCKDLQAVFDLAALIRDRYRPVAESLGQLKALDREFNQLPEAEALARAGERNDLKQGLEEARDSFRKQLSVIYGSALLSLDPSAVRTYVESYPVYEKDGDADAAVAALQDVETGMKHGSESLTYLLGMKFPVHEPGMAMRALAPVFPFVGGGLLTTLSHAYRDTAMFLKLTFFLLAGAWVTSFLANLLPRPFYRRNSGARFLRFLRSVTVGATASLVIALSLEPGLLQTPRGQVSVAGFDFALANLLMSGNDATMPEQSLTVVTGVVAGSFLLLQLVIFVFCLLRISQVKKEEVHARLKLELLDNEDNLFDLGLYVGLGGTVLSLILLLVLDVKQDALIGAYTSTLFGILFVAALKIFCVRPYRNHLLVMQAEDRRHES